MPLSPKEYRHSTGVKSLGCHDEDLIGFPRVWRQHYWQVCQIFFNLFKGSRIFFCPFKRRSLFKAQQMARKFVFCWLHLNKSLQVIYSCLFFLWLNPYPGPSRFLDGEPRSQETAFSLFWKHTTTYSTLNCEIASSRIPSIGAQNACFFFWLNNDVINIRFNYFYKQTI